jgi:hypothetical protein
MGLPMSPRVGRHRTGFLCLIFCLALPQGLNAQVRIFKELTLKAFRFQRNAFFHSYSRAYLYNGSDGRRIYSQIILGHGVADDTEGFPVFQSSTISENGYANSTTGDLPGITEHCYSALIAVHANAYNLHETLGQSSECIPSPPEKPEAPEENCPVLLDLDQDGFHLSGPSPAVRFDIDADGLPDSIAWTRSNDDDAFLCLDRNQNGVIDDGSELFGYATPLLSGQRARVGYRAMADLDRAELGGNEDGRVDSDDPAFRSLCAWIDVNRDGISQLAEIHTLEQVGVVSLDYQYQATHLRDSFGNLFRYVSSARMRSPSGAVRSWPTFDVIFAAPAPTP